MKGPPGRPRDCTEFVGVNCTRVHQRISEKSRQPPSNPRSGCGHAHTIFASDSDEDTRVTDGGLLNVSDQSRGNKAARTVILLERSSDVSDALSRSDIVASEVRYIALRPEVSQVLDLAGIEYGVPADYTDGDRIYRDGLSSFKEIHELCVQLDRRLCCHPWPTATATGSIRLYHLKMLRDVLYNRLGY